MKKKNSPAVFETNVMPYLFFLIAFAATTLVLRYFYLAAAEGAVILGLVIYALVNRRRRRRAMSAYIESVTYDAETAKNHTLLKFPLPIVVFRLSDSRIIWGNEKFFSVCGLEGTRIDTSVAELIPEFSGKWLVEGKTQYPGLLEYRDRRYQVYGNIVSPREGDERSTFMGIAYLVDATEFDELRREYERSRPVAAIITIDNFDELVKNQPERVKNDLREAVTDKLAQWSEDKNAILTRIDRDRYLMVFEERYMEGILGEKFSLLREAHQVVSPGGIHATLSIGIGRDAESFGEALGFASLAAEMALSRGGDQAVIKNRFNFEFFGGRDRETESESRTSVISRVKATAIDALIRDSSRVLIMGHTRSDMDSIGAAAGLCRIARKHGTPAYIVTDQTKTAATPLIRYLRSTPEYADTFIDPRQAILIADSRSLLIVVDTNRPEQVEDNGLLLSCNKVAVIDHHRRAATYIDRAVMSYIEPSASCVCELVTEMLGVVLEGEGLLRCEAEAMLAGIVLDTKSFTIRTNEHTFEAAAFLRRAGADTASVRRLMQSDMMQSVARYGILKNTKLYRGFAVAISVEAQDRTVAAQAADELLNVAGVDASVVMCPSAEGQVLVSARSIGDANVQILMEKLGGGGNKAAAAAQLDGVSVEEAAGGLYKAIDDYLDN